MNKFNSEDYMYFSAVNKKYNYNEKDFSTTIMLLGNASSHYNSEYQNLTKDEQDTFIYDNFIEPIKESLYNFPEIQKVDKTQRARLFIDVFNTRKTDDLKEKYPNLSYYDLYTISRYVNYRMMFFKKVWQYKSNFCYWYQWKYRKTCEHSEHKKFNNVYFYIDESFTDKFNPPGCMLQCFCGMEQVIGLKDMFNTKDFVKIYWNGEIKKVTKEEFLTLIKENNLFPPQYEYACQIVEKIKNKQKNSQIKGSNKNQKNIQKSKFERFIIAFFQSLILALFASFLYIGGADEPSINTLSLVFVIVFIIFFIANFCGEEKKEKENQKNITSKNFQSYLDRKAFWWNLTKEDFIKRISWVMQEIYKPTEFLGKNSKVSYLASYIADNSTVAICCDNSGIDLTISKVNNLWNIANNYNAQKLVIVTLGDISEQISKTVNNQKTRIIGLYDIIQVEKKIIEAFGDFKEKTPNQKNIVKKYSSQYLWSLDGWQFEQVVGNIFEKLGYDVQVTKGSGDGGVDIILLSPEQEKIIVQCKHYQQPVPPEPVRALWGCKDNFDADKVLLIASSGVTDSSMEFINSKNNDFLLYDMDKIIELVKSIK